MSRPRRRRLFGLMSPKSNSTDSHSERPWVYFMVDCFFLITEFFIISFKFKNEEWNLVGKLPAGGTKPGPVPIHTTNEIARIHILQQQGQTAYVIDSKPVALTELDATLSRMSGRLGLSVRISYEADIPWKDIIAVMNACTHYGLKDVGLQPLRATETR